MRLFGVYNRGYNLRYFIAENIDQALSISFAAGHTRRPGQFRKWVDLTNTPPPELASQIQDLLGSDRAGMLQETDQGWRLS